MGLVVDATAWDDLNQSGAWIAKDNPRAARAMLQRILQTIEQLQWFTRLARQGRTLGTYERVVAATPYIIDFELWQNPPVGVQVHLPRKRAILSRFATYSAAS